MNRPRWRYWLPVLLPILTGAAAPGDPTLAVDPTEVRADAEVSLVGSGFSDCVNSDGVDFSATPLSLTSEPPEIEVPDAGLDGGGGFRGTITVPGGTAPATYLITASCESLSGGGDIEAATLIVVDDQPVVEDPVDPGPGGDGPSVDDQVDLGPGADAPSVDDQADPASGTDPDAIAPDSSNVAVTTVAGISAAALVALLALLVGRSALRSRATAGTSTSVHVRAVTGVVVGPTVHRPAAGGVAVRVVPHADPGSRVLRPG